MITAATTEAVFPTADYNLGATLDSGQVFRWQLNDGIWTGVAHGRWVQLKSVPEGIQARLIEPETDWRWLAHFLQIDVDIHRIYQSFPQDVPMQQAVKACHGLRLLRQDPWECLASFILSSTKQIVQIRQIVALLCSSLGTRIAVPAGTAPMYSFPTATQLARTTESHLRACKMGFRAPNLLATARAVAEGKINLETLRKLPRNEARLKFMELPGVGGKIADCVLLFAYGFDAAFPVDVWIARALEELYFPKSNPTIKQLHGFAARHFGPNAGYAQQYLFHYIRTKTG